MQLIALSPKSINAKVTSSHVNTLQMAFLLELMQPCFLALSLTHSHIGRCAEGGHGECWMENLRESDSGKCFTICGSLAHRGSPTLGRVRSERWRALRSALLVQSAEGAGEYPFSAVPQLQRRSKATAVPSEELTQRKQHLHTGLGQQVLFGTMTLLMCVCVKWSQQEKHW